MFRQGRLWAPLFFGKDRAIHPMTDSSARRTSSVRFLPWLVVAAILLGVIGITLVRGLGTSSRSEEVPPSGVLSADVADSPIPQGMPSPKRAVAVDDPDLIANRRSEQRKKVQDTVDTSQSALASQFQSEKTDAAWAPSKQRALAGLSSSDQIKQLNADISNLSVDCKTHVCRITGDFPNMTAGDDWFTLYMNNVAGEVTYASYKYVPQPDGSVRIEVYGVGRK